MNPREYFDTANSEDFACIKGKATGREFAVRRLAYGVLVNNPEHPLSAVSFSNSSMSIDLWTGCAWQCRYCHVQGTLQDLVEDGEMAKVPRRRNNFTIGQIIEELLKHPYFVPDHTIISIGTASTEPFASGPVAESTFKIMDAFIDRGLRNPFWIVTKGGIPKGHKLDFARIVQATKGLMLSLCWADNPDTIEPMRNNRFKNIEEAKEAGAYLSWYMRPIVPEWSGREDRIEMMLLWVQKNYGNMIDMIVPGGLRWTEGIENGLVEIHRLPMPNIPRDDNKKALPAKLLKSILDRCAENFPVIPIYLKSSCALTHMLKIPSITSVQAFARSECEMSICPPAQRQICAKGKIYNLSKGAVQTILNKLGIPLKVVGWSISKGLITEPPIFSLTYAVRQAIFKHLAMGGMQ